MDNRLAELETVIRENLGAFLVVGKALLEIKEDQLYLQAGFYNFRGYCRAIGIRNEIKLTNRANTAREVSKYTDKIPSEKMLDVLYKVVSIKPEALGQVIERAEKTLGPIDVAASNRVAMIARNLGVEGYFHTEIEARSGECPNCHTIPKRYIQAKGSRKFSCSNCGASVYMTRITMWV